MEPQAKFDPALAALLGAIIGGVIGVVGTLITGWLAAGRERKAFRRTTSLQEIDRILDTYQHALNVLFNLSSGGGPDRATLGNLFAQVNLVGSPTVKELLRAYFDNQPPRPPPDVAPFVNAMTEHVMTLRAEIK